VWFAYFLGFGLTLLYKWGRFVYEGRRDKKSIKQSTLDWLLEPSKENAASWTATIGGVWVLGSIYINRIVEVSGLTSLPIDNGIAFFLGTIFEFTVPNLVKWFVGKIPDQDKG